MIRWEYRSGTVFSLGLLFSLHIMGTVAGSSLAQAPPRPAGAARWLGGDLVVRQSETPSLVALLHGAAPGPYRPLDGWEASLAHLRSAADVAAVVPCSVTRLILKSDLPRLTPLGEVTAIGVFPGAAAYVQQRIVSASGQPALDFSRGLLLPEPWLTRLETQYPRAVRRALTFFLDTPRAADPFNLTPTVLAGGYAWPDADGLLPPAPLCFMPAADFQRCTRTRLLTGPTTGPDPAGGVRRPPPFMERIGRGAPLDDAFLFSLGSIGDHLPKRPPAPLYLLIDLQPGSRPLAAALLPGLRRRLAETNTTAVLEAAYPPEAAWGDRMFQAWVVFTGAGFLIIVLLANIALRPVLKFPDGKTEGTDHPAWRPSFPGRAFLIALFFGTAGALGGLAFIPLYNLLAPADLKAALSAALASSLEQVSAPPLGLAAAAGFILLFAVLTLPGPLVRARRLIRRRPAAAPPAFHPTRENSPPHKPVAPGNDPG